MHLPDDNHVAVHLLKSLLGHLEAVARGIELVGLEGLVAEADVKRLIVRLVRGSGYISSPSNDKGQGATQIVNKALNQVNAIEADKYPTRKPQLRWKVVDRNIPWGEAAPG